MKRIAFWLVIAALAAAAADEAPLAHWQQAVAAADQGTRPLVVVTLGDSNTELPSYAVALRNLLQGGYGGRGLGYYTLGKRMAELPGAPKIVAQGAWTMYDFADDPKLKPPEKPWLALDGLWTSTEDAAATLTITFPIAGALRLHYQTGPGLGSCEVTVKGRPALALKCAAEKVGYGLAVLDAGTELQVGHVAGKVVLFGVDQELTALPGGAIVHQIGNAWGMAHQFAALEEEAYAVFFAAIKPDLVTVLLGTNDMCNGWDAAGYRTQMQTLLGKLRRTAPQASIMVISCPSCTFDRKGLAPEFAKVAQATAQENGCAFWDWAGAVGDRWQVWDVSRTGLLEYSLHYTTTGGSLLATQLLRQLGLDPLDEKHCPVLRMAVPAKP